MQLGTYMPISVMQGDYKGRRVDRSQRLRSSEGRIDPRLESNECSWTVGLAEAKAAVQLGPYSSKTDMQRGLEGCGV